MNPSSADCSSGSCVSSSSASSDCGSSLCSLPTGHHRHHQEKGELDRKTEEEMQDCRDFYAHRLQSLERFRHRCQKNEAGNDVEVDEEKEPDTSLVFMRLQSDMVSVYIF